MLPPHTLLQYNTNRDCVMSGHLHIVTHYLLTLSLMPQHYPTIRAKDFTLCLLQNFETNDKCASLFLPTIFMSLHYLAS